MRVVTWIPSEISAPCEALSCLGMIHGFCVDLVEGRARRAGGFPGHGPRWALLSAGVRIRFVLGAPEGSGRRARRGFA